MNHAWIIDNLGDAFSLVSVGCAGLHCELIPIKKLAPKSKLYGFDCNDFWLEQNLSDSYQYGIYYFHLAISSQIRERVFKHKILPDNDKEDVYSGTFFDSLKDDRIYRHGKNIKTERLDTICKNFNIDIDFLWIDAEGSEYEIILSMGDFRPKAIWTEIHGFGLYNNGISFEEFETLLCSMGYNREYIDNSDALYCRLNLQHKPYIPIE